MPGLALVCAGLAGCATLLGVAGVGGTDPQSPSESYACEDGNPPPLERWDEISGNLAANIRPAPGAATETSRVTRLLTPVSVAARGGHIYIADAGRREVLTYDGASRTIRAVVSVPSMDPRTRIHTDRALSLYVTNPVADLVTVIDLDGRMLAELRAPGAMVEPVAVVANDSRRETLVGDALNATVVVFNEAGSVTHVIGDEVESGPRFAGVVDLAFAPDQLFVLDRNRTVHLLSQQGVYRYGFGAEHLVDPAAIAVDQHNRVYVADNGDRSIKVFRGGEHSFSLGSSDGVALQQVTDLWRDGDLMYVADAAGASVKLFRVVPPCD